MRSDFPVWTVRGGAEINHCLAELKQKSTLERIIPPSRGIVCRNKEGESLNLNGSTWKKVIPSKGNVPMVYFFHYAWIVHLSSSSTPLLSLDYCGEILMRTMPAAHPNPFEVRCLFGFFFRNELLFVLHVLVIQWAHFSSLTTRIEKVNNSVEGKIAANLLFFYL